MTSFKKAAKAYTESMRLAAEYGVEPYTLGMGLRP